MLVAGRPAAAASALCYNMTQQTHSQPRQRVVSVSVTESCQGVGALSPGQRESRSLDINTQVVIMIKCYTVLSYRLQAVDIKCQRQAPCLAHPIVYLILKFC